MTARAARTADPATSRDAAEAQKPQSGTQRAAILAAVEGAGERGMTASEVSAATGIEYRSTTPRIGQLKREGLPQATKHTREGDMGVAQAVLVVGRSNPVVDVALPRLRTQRRMVFDTVQHAGQEGATLSTVSKRLRFSIDRSTACVRGLARAGLLVADGDRWLAALDPSGRVPSWWPPDLPNPHAARETESNVDRAPDGSALRAGTCPYPKKHRHALWRLGDGAWCCGICHPPVAFVGDLRLRWVDKPITPPKAIVLKRTI